MDARRRFVIAHGGRGGRPLVVHIITRQVDWLPGGFTCKCGHFVRGRAVIGPSAEHPICPQCERYANGERIR